MSIFGKIKDAVFGHKPAANTAPRQGQVPRQPNEITGVSPDFQGRVTNQPTNVPTNPPVNQPAMTPAITPAPAPISQVDVEHNLDDLADDRDLDWRSSIVDLMKVLGIDSSLDNRKELARELGYMGDLDGSAEMNMWLHKATMRALEENGGKVPPAMRD